MAKLSVLSQEIVQHAEAVLAQGISHVVLVKSAKLGWVGLHGESLEHAMKLAEVWMHQLGAIQAHVFKLEKYGLGEEFPVAG